MDIAVTVFATNIFGDSQATDPILISKRHAITSYWILHTTMILCIQAVRMDLLISNFKLIL